MGFSTSTIAQLQYCTPPILCGGKCNKSEQKGRVRRGEERGGQERGERREERRAKWHVCSGRLGGVSLLLWHPATLSGPVVNQHLRHGPRAKRPSTNDIPAAASFPFGATDRSHAALPTAFPLNGRTEMGFYVLVSLLVSGHPRGLGIPLTNAGPAIHACCPKDRPGRGPR